MKRLILLTIGLVIGLALVASAQPGPGSKMCGHDGPGMKCDKMCGGPGMMAGRGQMGDGPGLQRILEMADKLELTDAQRAKLKQMHETFQLERIDRRANLQKAEVRMRGLMRDDKTPVAEINKAIDEVSVLKADLAKMQFRHRAEMKSVLNDKQQQMLKDTRLERRKEVRVRVFEGDKDLEEIDEPDTPGPGGSH